jgi:hypothetical protein
MFADIPPGDGFPGSSVGSFTTSRPFITRPVTVIPMPPEV